MRVPKVVGIKVDKAFLGVANYLEVDWGSKIIQDFLNWCILFFSCLCKLCIVKVDFSHANPILQNSEISCMLKIT